jgi:midasin (ATPase involved in ribosome maturation)
LVGTYVCNETGEFQFKKGPLTVAAENGLWLILRNIEDTPSDLLSFLLPIIQENLLQVTSTLTIKPKLGFRIFVLSKGTPPSLDDRVFYQQDDIQPLLSLMYRSNVDALICND